MPALRRSDFISNARQKASNGLYVHSSPPRVLNLSSAHIRQLIRSGDVDKLEQLVIDGHGRKLVGEYSADYKTRMFLKSVPALMSKLALLHDAVNSNRLEELKSLLDEEPEKKKRYVMTRDESGVGLLHKAVYYDLKDIYKYLLDRFPALVSLKDSEGRTAYHYTWMCKDHLSVQKMLINAGADSSIVDNRQRSAKYYATHGDELELPNLHRAPIGKDRKASIGNRESLGFKKSNIRIWIHQRNLANLQQVVWEGHGGKLLVEHSNNAKVKRFLEAVPHIMGLIRDIHVDVQNDDLEALKNRISPPVPAIVLSGKDTNGLSPLHKAAGLGRYDIAEFIIQECPDSVYLTDNEGRTPLHFAAILKDDNKMTNYLIEHGADESALDNRQKSAAYYKSRNSSELDQKLLSVVPECPRSAKGDFGSNFDWSMITSTVPTEDFGKLNKKAEKIIENASKHIKTIEKLIKDDEDEEEPHNGHEENGDTESNGNEATENADGETYEEDQTTDTNNNEESQQEEEETNNEEQEDESLPPPPPPPEAPPQEEEEEIEKTNEEIMAEIKQEIQQEIKQYEAELDSDEPDNQDNYEEPDNHEESGRETESNDNETNNDDEKQDDSNEPNQEEEEEDKEQGRPSTAAITDGNLEKSEEGVIEGVVNGEDEVETLNEQGPDSAEEDGDGDAAGSAAGASMEEVRLLVEAGNMEKLASLVLNGEGEKLIGQQTDNPELQSFLDNVSVYMNKINRIHVAAREGSLKDLQAALDRRKFAIAKDSVSVNGASPLHVAVIFGNTSIVRYLAGRFPETVQVADDKGRTPLHYAATLLDNGHYYNLLVHLGADTRTQDKLGHTPEYYRLHHDEMSHRSLLTEFGAEDLADEILADKVGDDDIFSARKDLDDEDMLSVLERCYSVLHGRRSSNALSASSTMTSLSTTSTGSATFPGSLPSKHIRRYIFDKVKTRLTRLDHNLYDVIWPSVKKLPTERTFRVALEEDFPAGIIAPDFYSYRVFGEFMEPIIKDLNCRDLHLDLPLHPPSKFFEDDDESGDSMPELELDLDPHSKWIVSENGNAAENQVDMPFFATEEGRYLASSLGDPLIKGLTEVANKRPDDPIAYLATYLYNVANNPGGRPKSKGKIQETTQLVNGSAVHDADNNSVPASIDVVTVEPDLDNNPEENSAFSNTSRDEHGQSMLHFAAARAHSRNALFQLLLETEISVSFRDELYRTARDIAIQANIPENTGEIDRYVIHIATRGETDKLVELLLEGYDHMTDIVDEDDIPIADAVARHNQPDTEAFLQSILTFEEKRERVHHAIRQGNIAEVQALLADEHETGSGKLLALGKNSYARCTLHIAVLCQQEEIVDYLANSFPETLYLGDNLERTALHYAMGVEKIESLSRVLIKAGARRVAKDLKGRQPSYYFLNKSDIQRLQEEEETF